MVSKRIKLIASLLDKDDKVLDVGTDHALLPIYLVKNKLVAKVDASDISSVVLSNAKKNVTKFKYENDINLYLSDGLKSIDIKKYNTLVIAGMGFHTIEDILKSNSLENINKLIIQTNNNYEDFRKFISTINFHIKKEVTIIDKKIAYIIFVLKQGRKDISDEELVCGIYSKDNREYYKNELKKLKSILEKLPKSNEIEINKISKQIDVYESYLTR